MKADIPEEDVITLGFTARSGIEDMTLGMHAASQYMKGLADNSRTEFTGTSGFAIGMAIYTLYEARKRLTAIGKDPEALRHLITLAEDYEDFRQELQESVQALGERQ